jgi:LysR family hydrogen peroxide-inducible transcriptional activator
VKKLEDELGLVLFDRTRKPLAPTEAGLKVIQQAKKILSEVEFMERVLKPNDTLDGVFRIGVLPSVGPYLAPIFASDFLAGNDRLSLVMEEGEQGELLEALETNRLDAAILEMPTNPGNIECITVYYEQPVVYVPDNHPMTHKRQVPLDALDNNVRLRFAATSTFGLHANKLQGVLADTTDVSTLPTGLTYTAKNSSWSIYLAEKLKCLALLPGLAQFSGPESIRSHIRTIKGYVEPREVCLAYSKLRSDDTMLKELHRSLQRTLPRKVQEKPRPGSSSAESAE